jgi:hypothetical protein
VTIFGGSTQPLILWLSAHVDPLAPAWYQIVANVAATIAIILLVPHKESLPVSRKVSVATGEA